MMRMKKKRLKMTLIELISNPTPEHSRVMPRILQRLVSHTTKMVSRFRQTIPKELGPKVQKSVFNLKAGLNRNKQLAKI